MITELIVLAEGLVMGRVFEQTKRYRIIEH